MKKIIIITIACLFSVMGASAQFVHTQSKPSEYVRPTDKAVLDRLDKWQDLKFGVIFHWGLYSVHGTLESWSLCSEDKKWIVREGNMPYDEYKKWYWSINQEFNPVNFNPEQWADVMERAGMKYMIFTSKHHDGFCMYDSKFSDFSIAKGPFKSNPRRNAALHIWDAFRKKNFMVGCYFSKPDWHHKGYWNPYFATPTRHHNYKKENHPEWWASYQDYTYNQLKELMTDYGKFDIVWLDGGWVKGNDIYLDKLMSEIRSTTQPGLICVDRKGRNHNENYQTPEQNIPKVQLNYPWESCITLTGAWGWTPNAKFKSAHSVINILAEITAKGGSLLLGIGPTGDGLIDKENEVILNKIGDWLRVNGAAIYNTRITPHYNDEKVWFTADKNGSTLYAVYALADGESLPSTIEWSKNIPQGKIKVLNTGKYAKYKVVGDKVVVALPKRMTAEPIALQFDIKK